MSGASDSALRFTCKLRIFESGPAWTRTRDLFLIREVRAFLVRPVQSENPAYLYQFYCS